jgi:hypothetical protein
MSAKRNRRGKRKAAATAAIPSWFYAVCVGMVAVFFSAIRFRLRAMPLERDEGEYAYAGQLILQGVAPYRFAYSMKLPGTHAAYALIMAVFGQTPAGIHLGLLLVNAATVYLMFVLARRLFGSLAGLAAAASYAALSTSEAVLGFAAHATHFVVLAAVGALIMSLKAKDSGRRLHYFLAGLLAGLAFVCKQPGLLFALFCGAYLAISTLRRIPRDWRGLSRNLLIYGAGCALPFAVTCLWLFFAGELGRMWFWSFAYASKYGSSVGLAQGWRNLEEFVPGVVGRCWPVWILAAVGLGAVAWDSSPRRHSFFLLGLLAFSWVAVCPGLYFRAHYFVLLLPVASLLAGLAVSSSAEELLRYSRSPAVAALPVAVFGFALAFSVYSQREFFFELSPAEACRSIYRTNPFIEAVVISDYLRQQMGEKSTIAVIGSEPEIYFYSRRHSATGYIYTYPLMEHQAYAAAMQKEMAGEIEASQPEYVVFVRAGLSWLPRPDSDRFIFDWFNKYAENYQIVGVADGVRPEPQYVWGTAAETYRQRSPAELLVFRRKT